MPAQARFGERVPVPVTVFAPIATGGVAQQPITSFNYENIGVNIDITPRTHHDDEVSLALKIIVSSISGSRVRRPADVRQPRDQHGDPAARRRDEPAGRADSRRRAATCVEGVPGLSDIPLVGRLFAHTRRETQETDIVLTLTPRIIRVLDLTEEDLRPFRVGGEAQRRAVIDLPDAADRCRRPTPRSQRRRRRATAAAAAASRQPPAAAARRRRAARSQVRLRTRSRTSSAPGSFDLRHLGAERLQAARRAGCSRARRFRAAARASGLRRRGRRQSATSLTGDRGCRARGRRAASSAR